MIQKRIQQLWKQEECPLLDGILYADGTLITLEISDYPERNGYPLELIVKSIRSIEDYEHNVNLTPICKEYFSNGGIICGGSSYGSEGFVAIQKVDGSLLWIALFDNSNPFVELKLLSKYFIQVKNNLDEYWLFCIQEPSKVVISDVQFKDGS